MGVVEFIVLSMVGVLLHVWKIRATEKEIVRTLKRGGGWMFDLDIVKNSNWLVGHGFLGIHLARLKEQGKIVWREEPKIHQPRHGDQRPRRQYKLA